MPPMDNARPVPLDDTPRGRAILKVRQLVTQAVSGHSSKVYLVGSCARGDARRPSDIDVAIELLAGAPEGLIPEIRVALDGSDIPFTVDVFNLNRLPDDYRSSVLEDAIEWS